MRARVYFFGAFTMFPPLPSFGQISGLSRGLSTTRFAMVFRWDYCRVPGDLIAFRGEDYWMRESYKYYFVFYLILRNGINCETKLLSNRKIHSTTRIWKNITVIQNLMKFRRPNDTEVFRLHFDHLVYPRTRLRIYDFLPKSRTPASLKILQNRERRLCPSLSLSPSLSIVTIRTSKQRDSHVQ